MNVTPRWTDLWPFREDMDDIIIIIASAWDLPRAAAIES
jgi:hypothetical protein